MLVKLVVIGLIMFAPSTAHAVDDDGYPGTTTTQPPRPTREVVDHGRITADSEVQTESCGFRSGEAVTKQWNDEPSGVGSTDSNGCVMVRVTFTRSGGKGSQGRRCEWTATVDGRAHTAKMGRNTLVVAGTGANGAGREVEHRFVVQCNSGGGSEERAMQTISNTRSLGGMIAAAQDAASRFVWVAALLSAAGIGLVLLERRRLARRTD